MLARTLLVTLDLKSTYAMFGVPQTIFEPARTQVPGQGVLKVWVCLAAVIWAVGGVSVVEASCGDYVQIGNPFSSPHNFHVTRPVGPQNGGQTMSHAGSVPGRLAGRQQYFREMLSGPRMVLIVNQPIANQAGSFAGSFTGFIAKFGGSVATPNQSLPFSLPCEGPECRRKRPVTPASPVQIEVSTQDSAILQTVELLTLAVRNDVRLSPTPHFQSLSSERLERPPRIATLM
jgi:hypothetical protein